MVRQESNGEGLEDGLEIARGDCTWLLHEETAFSMSKIDLIPTMKEPFYNRTETQK